MASSFPHPGIPQFKAINSSSLSLLFSNLLLSTESIVCLMSISVLSQCFCHVFQCHSFRVYLSACLVAAVSPEQSISPLLFLVYPFIYRSTIPPTPVTPPTAPRRPLHLSSRPVRLPFCSLILDSPRLISRLWRYLIKRLLSSRTTTPTPTETLVTVSEATQRLVQ